MAHKIKNRAGYSKKKIRTRQGKQVFRWMRNQLPTWEIRGPKPGPMSPVKLAKGSALGCVQPSDAWANTSANRRLLAFNAANSGVDQALKHKAKSDTRLAGRTHKNVAPKDMRRLQTETAVFLDRAEARTLLADELRRPELAELRTRQGLDILAYSYALGGLHFALARAGHAEAFAYLDDPWRTDGIEAARAYGRMDPTIDPFGGVRLFAAEDYLDDPDLTD